MDVTGNITNNGNETDDGNENALIAARKKKPKSPPLWNNSTHLVFVQLCLNEARLGNKPGSHFNKAGKTIDASPEWWDEKIKANEDLAKFSGQNLKMYKLYYDPLFRDTVAVGDMTKLPLDCRLVDEYEEHQEGKGDSDENHGFVPIC
nr:hypothetical protein [Tanacetum cinerariifolium]